MYPKHVRGCNGIYSLKWKQIRYSWMVISYFILVHKICWQDELYEATCDVYIMMFVANNT